MQTGPFLLIPVTPKSFTFCDKVKKSVRLESGCVFLRGGGDKELQYVRPHCDSDLLAVDVLWWTLPEYSAFLARLGSGRVGG